MKESLSILKELYTDGGGFFVLIGIIFIIIVNLPKIYHFLFEVLKKGKLNNIKLAEGVTSFDEISKNFLSDYFEKEYFKISMGVNWQKELRIEVLTLCNDSNNNLNFEKFKYIRRHIEFLNSKISIKIDKLDIVSMIYNFIAGIIIVLLGISLFQYSFSSNQQITHLSLSLLLSIGGLFLLRDALITKRARDLRKELEAFKY
jgi:hypothetical protein